MALTASVWSANRRLQAASENLPPMSRGELDLAAVTLLQQVLIENGFAIPDGATGNYLNETAAAVRAVEQQFDLTRDNGVAGREVLTVLDALENGVDPPQSPKAAAEAAKPLALKWLGNAIFAINARIVELQAQGLQINPFGLQLNRHFHLDTSAAGQELANLTRLLNNYTRIQANLGRSGTIFRSVDDATAARETRGQFRPGVILPAYTFSGIVIKFTSHYPGLGANAQAAVVVHEMAHFISPFILHVGGESGPEYDNSDFRIAINNAHCYPNFAEHVTPPFRDERFGLSRPNE